MATSLWCRLGLVSILSLSFAGAATSAGADEIWVAPTAQADIGGIGVASNTFWPVTAAGVVRLAWAIPADLQTFQNARLVLIPSASSPTPVLTFYVCTAQSNQPVTANCAGPFTKGFTSTANQLLEIDMTDAISGRLGAPGASYLSVLAYTTPTTATDHIVGLRFRYAPAAPAGTAGLAANTFTGTQTAPAFVGDGSGLTNLPVPSGVATLGANTFVGTQTAPAFVGSGAGLTGVARLQANTFAATQTISSGNLDLPNSTSGATGVITLGGSPFVHRFGNNNTFLGPLAGNFTMTGAQNTATGRRALFSNGQGSNNTATGYLALVNNSDGSYNAAAGAQALGANTTGSFNTATGESALLSNTTGFNNTATGQQALGSSISGDANTATGQSALYANISGSHNMASGYHALMNNSIGAQNTAAGNFALLTNGNGLNNTALGFQADVAFGNLVNATAIGANAVVSQSNALVLGSSIVSVGIGTPAPSFKLDVQGGLINASGGLCINNVCQTSWPSVGGSGATLTANTFSGTQTIASGNLALPVSTSAASGVITFGGSTFLHSYGTNNTFLGVDTGNFSMTGTENTATGKRALFSNTSGASNTASGHLALFSNTTGSSNTAIGQLALLVNTTGSSNTAIGQLALRSNTFGGANTAIGQQALFSNTSGVENTATGQQSLFSNSFGSENTANGYFALFSNTSDGNTANGSRALYSNSTGSNNTATGVMALNSNTTGINNTADGAYALGSNTTGSLNTALGFSAGGFPDLTNATAIGANALVNASNKIRLGSSAVTVIEGQVAYTFTSDKTKKENFQPVNARDILHKLAADRRDQLELHRPRRERVPSLRPDGAGLLRRLRERRHGDRRHADDDEFGRSGGDPDAGCPGARCREPAAAAGPAGTALRRGRAQSGASMNGMIADGAGPGRATLAALRFSPCPAAATAHRPG